MNSSDCVKSCFSPDVPYKYYDRYLEIIYKVDNALPELRKKVLKNEINKIDDIETEDLKMRAILLVLYDLLNQGYSFSIQDKMVFLSLSQDNAESKDFIRNTMSFEKKAQLQSETVKKFIDKMEKRKDRNGITCSIKDLIGNPALIIDRLYNGEESIISPYLQMADNSIDEYTGFYLKDIWRYFRYTWSIPYKNTPGRNLYYLVRDSGQKYHPIIGIFALGNCILNLTVRDNEIGWTVDAVKKNMKRKSEISLINQKIDKERNSLVKKVTYLEPEKDYQIRVYDYSKNMLRIFAQSIDQSINEIYKKDLELDFCHPTDEMVDYLKKEAESLNQKLFNTAHTNEKNVDYETEAKKTIV